MEAWVAPVAILGASNTIHPHALQCFRGKHVLGFPDYDAAGINGMARWGKQLDGIAATFRVFSYSGLVRDDGHSVNDLRDFLRVDGHQWEDEEIRHPLASFIYPLLNKQNKEKGI
jgi:DNA primase